MGLNSSSSWWWFSFHYRMYFIVYFVNLFVTLLRFQAFHTHTFCLSWWHFWHFGANCALYICNCRLLRALINRFLLFLFLCTLLDRKLGYVLFVSLLRLFFRLFWIWFLILLYLIFNMITFRSFCLLLQLYLTRYSFYFRFLKSTDCRWIFWGVITSFLSTAC